MKIHKNLKKFRKIFIYLLRKIYHFYEILSWNRIHLIA